MFSKEDFEKYYIINKELFNVLEQYLLECRLGFGDTVIPKDKIIELSYYSSAVLGAIATEETLDFYQWRDIFKIAADIEYILFKENMQMDQNSARHHLFRSTILYESAGYHSISRFLVNNKVLRKNLNNFFSRDNKSAFGYLGSKTDDNRLIKEKEDSIVEDGLEEVLDILGSYMQNTSSKLVENIKTGMEVIEKVTSLYNFDINGDEIACLNKLISLRMASSIFKYVPNEVANDLKISKMPVELWRSQAEAINKGLLNEKYDSVGIATPTGTGKTAIAQVLLLTFLKHNPGKKAFYIVPSKALATQVSEDLSMILKPVGYKIAALGSHLTYNSYALEDPKEADLLVFTPEKADLILRVEKELLEEVNLVIVDEAHHIEAGTRGMLLEFYLWRVKKLVPKQCRIIQLSAVAPNIGELVTWLKKEKETSSLKLDWRPGKFRIGIYEHINGIGYLNFNTNKVMAYKNYEFNPKNEQYDINIINIGNLAHQLSKQGVVLILATSKKRAELIVEYVKELRSDFSSQDIQSELTYSMESLDAKLERELYAEVPLRKSISYGIAYHHSGLPSRVRRAIEIIIKEKKVNIVCATTTLAEGVNFPFSTVIVESLIIGINSQLSPRGLWNIAGRAGRYGVDSEGHCILYSPSLYVNKLKEYKLESYLENKLDSIPPVKSALAETIDLLNEVLESNTIEDEDLEELSLQKVKVKLKGDRGKRVIGLINIYRTGLAHAYANNLINPSEENQISIIKEMYAYEKLSNRAKERVCKIEEGQKKVLNQTSLLNPELLDIAARVGWAIESQERLLRWIETLENWQITSFGKIVSYGEARIDKLKYLLYPVAENMIEFEGDKLGGFTSYTAVNWIAGYSITDIRKETEYDFNRLVDLIYSRIQYLLPWALFGVSELLDYEARKRQIQFGSGVKDLSILASEGVPNFLALELSMKLDIERVDAVRLAIAYKNSRNRSDIIDWFKQLEWQEINNIVRGGDRRRLDPDLKNLHDNLHT